MSQSESSFSLLFVLLSTYTSAWSMSKTECASIHYISVDRVSDCFWCDTMLTSSVGKWQPLSNRTLVGGAYGVMMYNYSSMGALL